MAARPGEENVATLFGDIHYFYSGPEVKPRHHRFDKGSYVYLFENANERRCRIEIANHAGTPDQDAFDGFLDQTHVRYSYKQHCMVALTVAESVNQNEWHLPTFDPRNENKYHYKLQALDIYFWTQKDALQFINGVRRVLPPTQVEILDEPAPPPQPAAMSHVVQKLENAAISESQSTAPNPPSQSSSTAPAAAGSGLPPPPPPPPPQQQPASFVPMAYNPAAPAAPETFQHREKTPPPDEDPLNPLAVAVAYDYQKQPFTPGFPPQAPIPPPIASPGFARPMAAAQGLPPQPGTPGLPHPGLQRSATMPVVTQQPAQQPYQPQQQASPPVSSPGLPPPPPGGFSSFSYSHPTQAAPGQSDYSIHQQLYRPTEQEAVIGAGYESKEGKSKMGENAARFERGVSGMLKKFEKKFA
ncbi:unnamed protein product [Clonostachys rosea]|uniref:RNA recognition motif-containing protein n=1 Tax=Bionectria ochroleuca TaxID=29856 RepID=A0ABY6UFN3_BIOOC|nr:unnamed protein product [Clonostachys rosea]